MRVSVLMVGNIYKMLFVYNEINTKSTHVNLFFLN